MAAIDNTYREILSEILRKGYEYEDPNRKDVKRKEIFSTVLRHDLVNDGFPALTTKEVYFKGAVAELLFFFSGSTDIRDLWKRGVRFWDKDWSGFNGHLPGQLEDLYSDWKQYDLNGRYSDLTSLYNMGKIYPKQYRNFGGVDQLLNLVNTMRENPMSTSLIVNSWNVPELSEMCLIPCHYSFQILMRPLRLDQRWKGSGVKLNLKESKKYKNSGDYYDSLGLPKYGFELHWSQRSTDFLLGTPINTLFYATMAKILEKLTGHRALAVQGDLKNVHLYDNQIAAAKEQLTRSTETHPNCELELSDNFDLEVAEFLAGEKDLTSFINNLSTDDFKLKNYDNYPPIKVEMLAYNK